MNRCSTSLIIREIHQKDSHSNRLSVGEDIEKGEPLCTVGGKQYGGSSKTLKKYYHMA